MVNGLGALGVSVGREVITISHPVSVEQLSCFFVIHGWCTGDVTHVTLVFSL